MYFSLEGQHWEEIMKVMIEVSRKGVERVALLPGRGQTSSFRAFSFYAQVEPAIEEFKKSVRKCLSAYAEKREGKPNNDGEPSP
jgi:hypothetical protein